MTRPVERHIQVPRTARYQVLGDTVTDPTEVWFVLHGYGQLAHRFLRRFEPIDDGRRRIVAPEALSRFYASAESGRHGAGSVVGATWMTREDREREIEDYVRYLDTLSNALLSPLASAPRVVVVGFSQGVATASRWCALGAMRPSRLVLWGDFLPPDLDLGTARDAWSGTDVVLVRGSEDAAVGSEKLAGEEGARITAAGLPLRRVSYEGGHDIDAATLATLT